MIVMIMREREVWVGRELFGGPIVLVESPVPLPWRRTKRRESEYESERRQKTRERERAYSSNATYFLLIAIFGGALYSSDDANNNTER